MRRAVLADSIGWILIAIIVSVASEGAADIGRLAWTIAGASLFLAASLTFGRRFVSIAFVHDSFASEFPVVTLILVIMCGPALTTEALGVQAVLGAFVAGILICESPTVTKHISDQLRGMVASFFAPVFFALAGLNSDLTILGSPRIALLAGVLASVGKFAGAFIGGAIGRRREHRPVDRRGQPGPLFNGRRHGGAHELARCLPPSAGRWRARR